MIGGGQVAHLRCYGKDRCTLMASACESRSASHPALNTGTAPVHHRWQRVGRACGYRPHQNAFHRCVWSFALSPRMR